MGDDKKKKAEQEFFVDTKENIEYENDALTERINRLYGVSSTSKEEKKQYDPKELESTRKKLLLLLLILIIGIFCIIFILFGSLKWGSSSNLNDSANGSVIDKVDDDKIPLGEMDLSNSIVISLNNSVSFTVSEFANADLFELYNKEGLDSINISNDTKLYLLKRSNYMYEILKSTNVDEFIIACDPNGLSIDKLKFDEAIKSIFGPTVTIEYKDINYSYYSDGVALKKLTLSYVNDQYIVKCNDYQVPTEINEFAQQKLIKAVKTDIGIELYQNVVFVNSTGVYKDPQFTTLITNDKAAITSDYITSGNIYKYIFIENEEEYYLSRIELLKEASS